MGLKNTVTWVFFLMVTGTTLSVIPARCTTAMTDPCCGFISVWHESSHGCEVRSYHRPQRHSRASRSSSREPRCASGLWYPSRRHWRVGQGDGFCFCLGGATLPSIRQGTGKPDRRVDKVSTWWTGDIYLWVVINHQHLQFGAFGQVFFSDKLILSGESVIIRYFFPLFCEI